MFARRIGPILIKNPPEDLLLKYKFESEDFFTGELRYIQLFHKKSNNEYYMPRYAIKENIPEQLSDGQDIDIECYAKPRDDRQKQAVKYMIEHNDCLLNLAPRRGKTVISIMAISEIKKKTLILLDQEVLLKQWISRIIEFTNLTEENIGIFQADKEELEKPIVIGMVQTLKNRVEKNLEELREKLKDFGLVIIDEVHTIVGTEKLSLPLFAISSKRLVGLSATLYRSDNRTFLFYDWFSENVYSDHEFDIIPKIQIIGFNSYLNKKETFYIMNNYFKTGEDSFDSKNFFNKLKWVKKLQNNHLIIHKISILINQLYKQKRTILIICEYIDFMQAIIDYLVTIFQIPQDDIELFTDSQGSLKEKLDKKKKKRKRQPRKPDPVYLEPSRTLSKQITFSTQKMCNKGVDRPDWDTLLLLTPISVSSPDLKQTIARICTWTKNKKDSLIFDFFDFSVPRTIQMAKARKRFYEKEEFEIISSDI